MQQLALYEVNQSLQISDGICSVLESLQNFKRLNKFLLTQNTKQANWIWKKPSHLGSAPFQPPPHLKKQICRISVDVTVATEKDNLDNHLNLWRIKWHLWQLIQKCFVLALTLSSESHKEGDLAWHKQNKLCTLPRCMLLVLFKY